MDSTSDARTARVRINFRWLIKLRWAAVLGQLITVLSVAGFFGYQLPWAGLLSIIAVTAASNAVLHYRFREELSSRSGKPWVGPGDSFLAILLAIDVLLLSALLYAAGGSSNPFSIFYLVHIVLAGIVLRPWLALAVGFESVLCFAALFAKHIPLAVLEGADKFTNIHNWGILVSFAAVALIIAWFVVRITEELVTREDDLWRARQDKVRHDRLEALITLAAGAAHELSTPLSTIAVAAKEIQRELELRLAENDSLVDAVEDTHLISRQLERCRDILEQMSEDSGQISGEHMKSIELGQLLQWAIDPLPHRERVRIQCDEEIAALSLVLPRRALARALRGLVKNAIDATSDGQEVQITLGQQGDFVVLSVEDSGEGMNEDVLSRVYEPFYTTKSAGRGMGLGLYLTRSVLERLDGSITIDSEVGRGTHVIVSLPLHSTQIESDNDVASHRLSSSSTRSAGANP